MSQEGETRDPPVHFMSGMSTLRPVRLLRGPQPRLLHIIQKFNNNLEGYGQYLF
jgi:hypothetical protein